VESHHGRLLLGTLGGKTRGGDAGALPSLRGLLAAAGDLPGARAARVGATTLVVSNACGGMHPLWAPGDLMLIADHINLLGDNPLDRAARRESGAAFPGHECAVRRRTLRELARTKWRSEQGITVREGVYVAVLGSESRDARRVSRCCARWGRMWWG
jgi:purine-nucleoside phosphorylase